MKRQLTANRLEALLSHLVSKDVFLVVHPVMVSCVVGRRLKLYGPACLPEASGPIEKFDFGQGHGQGQAHSLLYSPRRTQRAQSTE